MQLHLPFFLGLAIATIGTAIGGIILYLLVMRRIRTGEQAMLRVLIASIMLVTLLTQFVLLVFGTSPRGIPPVFKGHWKIWGVVIGLDRVAVILISIAILLALHFFLSRTRIGRGMRTVAFNPDVAALLGVNSEKVFIVTIGVGLGLVGFAGGLMAPILGVDITMGSAGFMVLLVIILGGIGSMVGSILSGILLGHRRRLQPVLRQRRRGADDLLPGRRRLLLLPAGRHVRQAAAGPDGRGGLADQRQTASSRDGKIWIVPLAAIVDRSRAPADHPQLLLQPPDDPHRDLRGHGDDLHLRHALGDDQRGRGLLLGHRGLRDGSAHDQGRHDLLAGPAALHPHIVRARAVAWRRSSAGSPG